MTVKYFVPTAVQERIAACSLHGEGALGVKGYWEFASQNRPEGWNTWVSFAISPAAPQKVVD